MCLSSFPDFWFPVPVRERLPKGKLPLSEVLHQSICFWFRTLWGSILDICGHLFRYRFSADFSMDLGVWPGGAMGDDTLSWARSPACVYQQLTLNRS